jgi:endonuclease-8
MMFGSYRINDHSVKPARLHLQFANGELNFYACVLHLIKQPLNEVYDWTADVMSPDWDAEKAVKKMNENPKLLACDALMDQHIFSGVGNIIKNEVLFRTRIHPLSLVNKLPAEKLKEVMTEAVKYSFDFLKWKKEKTLSRHWEAYDQQNCPRNQIPFHKKDTGKGHRTSYFCNACQVLYSN